MATPDEVYQIGMAAEAAQLLETSLGSALFAIQCLQNEWNLWPNPEQAQAALDRLDESTLGALLKEMHPYIDLRMIWWRSFSRLSRHETVSYMVSFCATISRVKLTKVAMKCLRI